MSDKPEMILSGQSAVTKYTHDLSPAEIAEYASLIEEICGKCLTVKQAWELEVDIPLMVDLIHQFVKGKKS